MPGVLISEELGAALQEMISQWEARGRSLGPFGRPASSAPQGAGPTPTVNLVRVFTISFTGNTTNTQPQVTSLSSTTNLQVGQIVTGTGIPANSTILSIDSSTQITLSNNATANGSGVSLSVIQDADGYLCFPQIPNGASYSDGTNQARVVQSNSVALAAGKYLARLWRVDPANGMLIYQTGDIPASDIPSAGWGTVLAGGNADTDTSSTIAAATTEPIVTGVIATERINIGAGYDASNFSGDPNVTTGYGRTRIWSATHSDSYVEINGHGHGGYPQVWSWFDMAPVSTTAGGNGIVFAQQVWDAGSSQWDCYLTFDPVIISPQNPMIYPTLLAAVPGSGGQPNYTTTEGSVLTGYDSTASNGQFLIVTAGAGRTGIGDYSLTAKGTSGQIMQYGSPPGPVTVSGDCTIASGGAVTLASTGVTAGTYGSASFYPIITVDAKGRITAASQHSAGGGGSGTVTSVALSDGSTTPIYSITGSPVTGAGTLTFTFVNQNANLVLAGPSSGSPAQPTFRALVSADMPSSGAGSGTVTSVAMTGDGTVFNATVSGSPITSSGTLAPALLTQTKNTVLAGPASGSAAAPTFRALGFSDLPNLSAYQVASNITGSAASMASNIGLIGSASVTLTFSDSIFLAASGSANKALFTLPAGGVMLGWLVSVDTAFLGVTFNTTGNKIFTAVNPVGNNTITMGTAGLYGVGALWNFNAALASTTNWSIFLSASSNFGTGSVTHLTQGSLRAWFFFTVVS